MYAEKESRISMLVRHTKSRRNEKNKYEKNKHEKNKHSDTENICFDNKGGRDLVSAALYSL